MIIDKKNRLGFSLLPTLGLLLLISSCCKENNGPTNPTNGHTTARFNPNLKYGTMADQDGNIYKTIAIGTQVWMAENLRTTKYRNGEAIPNVTGNAEWGNLTTGAYCYYNNTKDIDSIATFGGLYNWYTVSDSRGLAPKGWHVPTDADWTTLVTYLGDGDLTLGNSIAGGMMKESGGIHWGSFPADNSSGFTALAGGWRNYDDGSFDVIHLYGSWWSSIGIYYAYFFSLNGSESSVFWAINYPRYGYSVRCIKN
ncbi:MAG: hypothetical protein HOO91_13495 [Bacteroidales bacterium]|nr:hypothetical protein [Bacteroidales bacterium]